MRMITTALALALSLSGCTTLRERPWLLAAPVVLGVGVGLALTHHRGNPGQPSQLPLFPPSPGIHVVTF